MKFTISRRSMSPKVPDKVVPQATLEGDLPRGFDTETRRLRWL
jgi:hypothetical protein